MRLNSFAINTLYDFPSWLIHIMSLILSIGYAFYHLKYGVPLIGIFAFISTIGCTMAIIKIITHNPSSIYYYVIFISQFFALTTTSYYFGTRGLILVAPFVSGAFFLFPYKHALIISSIFVSTCLLAALNSLEIVTYIRYSVAILFTYFFTITFSHVILNQQKVLEKEANFDFLTDIPNRRGVLKQLDKLLAKSRDEDIEVCAFYMDLDKFKLVNDTYGHDVGDELLINFSKRVLSALRKKDLIVDDVKVCNFGRLSGDEFLLTIQNVETKESASAIAERIVNAIDYPFNIFNHKLDIHVSIGISYASACNYDKKQLLKVADTALYTAKKIPGSSFVFS